jgi:alpha-ketoglutarate-dependent taurine dioxygenase
MARFVEPRSWSELPVFNATKSAEDILSVDRNTVVSNFKKYGVVLFRSFLVEIDRFQALAESYSTTRVPYPGTRRLPVSPDGRIQTVDAGSEPIPLHSELSHTPFRPDICWFYCVEAPSRGSETTLCDGSFLAASLPRPIIDLLKTRMLRYKTDLTIDYMQRLLGTSDIATLQDFLKTSPGRQYYRVHDGKIRQDFLAPALHKSRFQNTLVFANNIIHNSRLDRPLLYPTFEDGSVVPPNLIARIKDEANCCTFEIVWHNEDLLMLDNTRYMHGRQAILDPRRTIWTQFSNANF